MAWSTPKTDFATGDVLTAAQMNAVGDDLAALGTPTINAQTGTSYTLALTDQVKLVSCSNASAFTLTVPPNSSVAFATGSQIIVYQAGAGQVTLTAGAGVTINSNGAKLKLTGQYAVATLIKIDTNTWVAAGNLSA